MSEAILFDAAVKRFSSLVDEELGALIAAEEPVRNLHDGIEYALGLDLPEGPARGKRIRPVLCLATAEFLGADPRQALSFACGIELMHNFALVHDDIEDGDEQRRNRPAVWKRYGLAHGINIGDYLFCKVLSVLLRDKDVPAERQLALLRLMSDTLDHTHIGQSLDISARSDRNFTHTAYYRLIREKTSYYLAAPMLGGAIVAGAAESVRKAIEVFGHEMGPLFQITDDLLDLTAGKGRGGSVGNDLREGKRSFLVAETTAQGTKEDVARLYQILDAPREETTADMIAEAQAIFARCGALETARGECERLKKRGLEALGAVPGPLAGFLAEFARRMVERQN